MMTSGGVPQRIPDAPERDRVSPVDIDGLRICKYHEFEALSSSYSDLLGVEGARNLHWNRLWLQALIHYGAPTASAPLLLGVEDAAGVAAGVGGRVHDSAIRQGATLPRTDDCRLATSPIVRWSSRGCPRWM